MLIVCSHFAMIDREPTCASENLYCHWRNNSFTSIYCVCNVLRAMANLSTEKNKTRRGHNLVVVRYVQLGERGALKAT